MTVKAVFFDIDGTLLTDKRTVSQSTIEAINALKQQGILVGLATGRGPRFLLPYMASLGLDMAIAYNGQYIFSREKVLFSQELDQADVRAMVDYAQETKKDIAFGTATGVVGSNLMSAGTGNLAYRIIRLIPDSWAGLITFLFNRVVRYIRPQNQQAVIQFLAEPIYQVLLLATAKETNRLATYYPHLTFTRSSPYAADVISQGNSKLQGIIRLGKHYDFDTGQVMVFGDSDNDLEMLGGVGYSIAMKNGTKQARSVASYVTDSNNHDGIYKAIVHYHLMEERHVSE